MPILKKSLILCFEFGEIFLVWDKLYMPLLVGTRRRAASGTAGNAAAQDAVVLF